MEGQWIGDVYVPGFTSTSADDDTEEKTRESGLVDDIEETGETDAEAFLGCAGDVLFALVGAILLLGAISAIVLLVLGIISGKLC